MICILDVVSCILNNSSDGLHYYGERVRWMVLIYVHEVMKQKKINLKERDIQYDKDITYEDAWDENLSFREIFLSYFNLYI